MRSQIKGKKKDTQRIYKDKESTTFLLETIAKNLGKKTKKVHLKASSNNTFPRIKIYKSYNQK